MAPARTGFTLSPTRQLCRAVSLAALAVMLVTGTAGAQRRDDAYHPPADTSTLGQINDGPSSSAPSGGGNGQGGGYGQNTYGQPQTYGQQQPYGQPPPYSPPQAYGQGAPPYPQPPYNPQGYANNGYNAGPRAGDAYQPPRNDGYGAQDGYGAPYSPANNQGPARYQSAPDGPARGYYSQGEIADAGRGFFGSITKGLASAIEYTYQNVGRPNGYLLGEDGGGAFFAGLRYGEGKLYTKDAGDHKVFWQGPSLGYDIGGEGSKIMVLVYNMSDPSDLYHRFGGVEGSTYLVGGIAVQLQKWGDVTLAIIRSGVGLRLGVNVGYLKYTREPTWNPF